MWLLQSSFQTKYKNVQKFAQADDKHIFINKIEHLRLIVFININVTTPTKNVGF